MKQHKKFRGFVSIIMALLMMVSVLCCTASAANNSTLSDTVSQLVSDGVKLNTNVILTSTLHPTPDNPLKYAYTVRVSVSDPLGRAITKSWPHGYYLDFYLSQAAYNAGEKPIASAEFYTDEFGKAEASYIDTFTKDPPSTLFFKARKETNTYFTPSQGTVAPMLYVDN